MSEDDTNKPQNDYGSDCVYGDCDRKSDGKDQGRIQDFVLGGAYRDGNGACSSKLARVSGKEQ